ncbi:MAG: hypothetical protein ACREA4_05945 [Nitrososphaera sp.]
MPSRAEPLLAAKLVFSNKTYGAVAIGSGIAFWILFNFLDGLLFFSPVIGFYYPLPQDAMPGLVLSTITSALVGTVFGMNLFIFRGKLQVGKGSFLSGSALGTASSVCASCSSVGFYLASTFATAGVVASNLLANYQLPLRLIAIGLLVLAYYSAHRRIVEQCRVAS